MDHATSYPAAMGGPVTQGHADYCKVHGHATHTSDGVDQGVCPRCGESVPQRGTDEIRTDGFQCGNCDHWQATDGSEDTGFPVCGNCGAGPVEPYTER